MSRPAVEVRTRDGRVYRIWADGRTEGFPEDSTVVNFIPSMLHEAQTPQALIEGDKV